MGNLLPILGVLGAAVGAGWAYMNVKSGKGTFQAVVGAVLFLVGAGFASYFAGIVGGDTGVMISDVVGGFLGGFGAGLAVVAALKETVLK
jgi:hypothetical protein